MIKTAASLALALLSGLPLLSPSSAAAQYGNGATIWVENDRSHFRNGDRLRVRFRTDYDAYVAVVHVDPSGYLDFVYPRSPWDDGYVYGGRTQDVDGFGWGPGVTVRGGSGIGYLYVIASPEPLDYQNFRLARNVGWDWSYAGRHVNGDPFWAMEQIRRTLVPDWSGAASAADYYTYYVGGYHRYPAYACGRYTGWGWGYHPGWRSYYGSCGRLDSFVRVNVYFFDRRYRGDRLRYYRTYRDYRDWSPQHVYRNDPRGYRPPRTARPIQHDRAPVRRAGNVDRAPVTRPDARPPQRAEPQGRGPQRIEAQPNRATTRSTTMRPEDVVRQGGAAAERRPVRSSERAGGSEAAVTRRVNSPVRESAARPQAATGRSAPAQAPSRPSATSRQGERPSAAARQSERPSATSRQGERPSASTRPTLAPRPSERPSRTEPQRQQAPERSRPAPQPRGGSERSSQSSRPAAKPRGGSERSSQSSRPAAQPRGGSDRSSQSSRPSQSRGASERGSSNRSRAN